MTHVGVQSFYSFIPGHRAHLGDIPGSNRSYDIVGEIASLAYGGSVNVATDTACSAAHQTT